MVDLLIAGTIGAFIGCNLAILIIALCVAASDRDDWKDE